MTRLRETTTTAIIKSVTYVSGSNWHLSLRSYKKKGAGASRLFTMVLQPVQP
jgi:hypothetical protein